MSKTTIVGYPRIGVNRELKFITEAYFKNEISVEELSAKSKILRQEYWNKQKDAGIDIIPSNDFSYYDNLLDAAFLLNAIPKKYKELGLSPLDTYFAMARGYQKEHKDVKALPMKKWFNTNYHYIVSEIDDDTKFSLNDTKPFDLYREAKSLGIDTKPVIIGAFTFLKLAHIKTDKSFEQYLEELSKVYIEILDKFEAEGISYIQIDEPILVTDLSEEEINLFISIYDKILSNNYKFKTILQTYFGDIRDLYPHLKDTKFDILGLDFVEGKKTIELIENQGFPKDKLLIAGIVNGKNIWINNYKNSIEIINELKKYLDEDRIYIGTSCSLLHVPHTIAKEDKITDDYRESLAFAEEKLVEINDLKELSSDANYSKNNKYIENSDILERKNNNYLYFNKEIRERVQNLKEADFVRVDSFDNRREAQKKYFNLPILPTTTIGSFPQTKEVKKLRQSLRKGEISIEQYEDAIKDRIKDIIKFQEEIGLDVLVHGEYERTDMVEYFGRLLHGFLFTQNGWVQSYGTRAVKPPIIYGDVKRKNPMTVEWIKYAQNQTDKPVKGMLTGPITILNWSFPREDLELKQIAYQIGLAIGEEVLDLEKAGIKIIQIDEAALREKLPLRKEDWKEEYLDWAIPAFRLTNSKVKIDTQIHTHMCYSEFSDIIKEIEAMDADVISIEAARSDSSLLDFLRKNNFKLEIGPGVYDIHSPRVPAQDEIEELIKVMINKLDVKKLWVNPDCGLKTRGMKETKLSLINMVNAVKKVRKSI
ncbi:MAG: 5-methyltetrahydropteroyltriglutamate--homocysteine S-methyltransferase [Clostridium sp.]|uniref:5-methyltetrahydropteroyltriglutamate-- homocysteine S-methyltransferase n=1 Tax=Clostridium sp. TaxID=1506 RepID=UPI0039EB0EC8